MCIFRDSSWMANLRGAAIIFFCKVFQIHTQTHTHTHTHIYRAVEGMKKLSTRGRAKSGLSLIFGSQNAHGGEKKTSLKRCGSMKNKISDFLLGFEVRESDLAQRECQSIGFNRD